jgi:hypothetical protein
MTITANITAPIEQFSLYWLFITTIVALFSGFISSWLYFYFIKRKELEETIKLELDKLKKERVSLEIIRWANPIHRAVQCLCYQLRIILTEGKDDERREKTLHEDSTLFYFAQYFAWIELLQEQLNKEIFRSRKHEDYFYNAIFDVGKKLNKYDPENPCEGHDRTIVFLQQRAMGEKMLVEDGDQKRCINYLEFLEMKNNADFKEVFRPLRDFLRSINLTDKRSCGWQRLLELNEKLINLSVICEQMLSIESIESDLSEGKELRSFLTHIQGGWWERMQFHSDKVVLSFFTISQKDQNKSLTMKGQVFNNKGECVREWSSVEVRIWVDLRTLFFRWEGQHPCPPEGPASREWGFGTFEFDHSIGNLKKGKGNFMDFDPIAIRKAVWYTASLKRITNERYIDTMTNGSLSDKAELVEKILAEW